MELCKSILRPGDEAHPLTHLSFVFDTFLTSFSIMFSSLFLPATLLFISTAKAVNDWSVPCHSGSCAYTVNNGTASGSMMIVSTLSGPFVIVH